MVEACEVPFARRRLSERWGHRAPGLLAAAIGAAIALGIRRAPPSALSVMASGLLLAFVLVTWLFMREHDRRLCETCAAAMPLNPAGVAARCRRRFWTVHAGNKPRILVPYLLVLVSTNFLMSGPGRLVWAVVQASMIYLILSHASHRRLQPWCPWCSGGGGGTDRPVDAPDLPRDDRLLV